MQKTAQLPAAVRELANGGNTEHQKPMRKMRKQKDETWTQLVHNMMQMASA